jgi:hypothetical protein
VPDAGHSVREPGITRELVAAVGAHEATRPCANAPRRVRLAVARCERAAR